MITKLLTHPIWDKYSLWNTDMTDICINTMFVRSNLNWPELFFKFSNNNFSSHVYAVKFTILSWLYNICIKLAAPWLSQMLYNVNQVSKSWSSWHKRSHWMLQRIYCTNAYTGVLLDIENIRYRKHLCVHFCIFICITKSRKIMIWKSLVITILKFSQSTLLVFKCILIIQ